jgi:two-component system chemotaxis response regulator CheB
MSKFDLVVIGASAGGVEALCSIVRHLPADLDAAVLVVMHIGEASSLAAVLNRCGTLPCRFVRDSPKLEPGHLYIAPANYHMRVENGAIELSQGPKENLRRPAIDPLFRSAARLYRKRVIGVILTGALDDGAAGLFAIKSRGGISVVQDPADALEPSMPIHAMRHTKIDYRLPVSKIGPLLMKLVGRQKKGKRRLMRPSAGHRADNPVLVGGKPFPVSCPECQGPLFLLKQGRDNILHCRVGHSYSSESLNEAHDEALERALWTAVRTLGERIILHRTMEKKARKGDPQLARRLRETVEYAQHEIHLLKEILQRF